MFGRTPNLSRLELQKQLLVAESEVNRTQLSRECQALKDHVRDLTVKARAAAAWGSGAALLVAGLTASRDSGGGAKANNPSWFQKMLKIAQLANSILQAFRAAVRGARSGGARQ